MEIKKRIRICRLVEQIQANPEFAKRLKIEDESHYRRSRRTLKKIAHRES